MFGANRIVGQKEFADAGDKLMVTSVFVTLQGEGPYAGRPAVFLRLAYCNLACSFCFPDYYRVKVRGKGSVKLKDVVVGDEVPTLDNNLQPTWTTVEAIHNRKVPVSEMRRITYEEAGVKKTITCTKEHPFNVKDVGFIAAEDLQVGMIVHHLSGDDFMSFNMTTNNPMRDPKVAAQMSATLKEGYASGRLSSWERDDAFKEMRREAWVNNNPMRNPELVKKNLENRTYQMTAFEKHCLAVLDSIDSRFVWVGNDNRYIIGDDQVGYRIPDFAIPGTNKLLEVYHSGNRAYARRSAEEVKLYKQERKEHFSRFGYDVMILSEKDLDVWIHNGKGNTLEYSHIAVDTLKSMIGKYATNGARIIAVDAVPIKAHSHMSRLGSLDSEGNVTVMNMSCAPYNTFLMRGLHTHNCDTFFDHGDPMSLEEIDTLIKKRISDFFDGRPPEWATYSHGKNAHSRQMVFVLTGGEPTLQPNATMLLQAMDTQFIQTQIETNGILPRQLPSTTTLVVSPKCLEKDGEAVRYIKPHPIVLDRADCLKFLLSADPESVYHTVPNWALDLREKINMPIYVSPINEYVRLPAAAVKLRQEERTVTIDQRSTVEEVISFWEPGLLDMERNQANHEHAARYALRHGLILSLQQHLYASMP